MFAKSRYYLWLLGVCASGGAIASSPDEQFTLKVEPILSEKCFACHGDDPEKIKGGLNLRSREGFLNGGETIDNLLVPGDPARSFLMAVIRWEDADYEMPPKENDRLTPAQISEIETWIRNGAPWPDDEAREAIRLAERSRTETDEGLLVETSGGQGDNWTYRRYKREDLWAFRPVEKPAVPKDAAHPVDAFVRSKLAAKGIGPAPRADHATLLRRLCYTLTGLPVTPVQMRDWMKRLEADYAAEYPRIVDELLASPHYGERWAQHWLDVVRYADTAGFSNDYERSNAWRFRDYVVRSLNDDKSYDRFIFEQIAGDELDPGNPEMTIATGFLRMGPWEHTPMVAAELSRQQYLDDVVDTVGQAFLSTPMSCCKCHDHKFDPIPMRDYYRLYAAFSTTQPAEMPAEFLSVENRDAFAEDQAHVEALLSHAMAARDRLTAKREDGAKAWYAERGLPYKDYKARVRDPEDKKPPRFVGLTTEEEGRLKVRQQDVKIWTRRLERFQPLAQSVYTGADLPRHSSKLRPPADAGSRKPGKTVPEDFVLTGGSVFSKAEVVTAGVLSVLGLPIDGGSGSDPYSVSGGWEKRRLGVARWIASPRNSLTTRSIVNRVWAWHFGAGIAGNPNNFGATGKKPTHPELLDFLAATFVEEGWSFKKLHRLILTSQTWQQATTHPERKELARIDPNNALLASFRPRRLTAEEVRDSLLVFSGELNRTVGGLPARPEVNREVALAPRMIQFSLAPAYQPNKTPRERNRRSLYAYRVRGLVDPLMEVFNKPNADDPCEHRDAAAVTPQVFTLLNSEFITNRSLSFARRLDSEAASPGDRITRAYQLVLARQPTAGESESLLAHYHRMVDYHRKQVPEPVAYPTRVTRSLVEELSGEPFEYDEWLDIFADYTPDPQAADQTPEVRALADVCLILFNTNELMYLY